ncbi:MAG: hypothetical protein ACJ8IK_04345 [Burkholderiaceae bacterium]|jgi:hypothetical protein
MKTRRPTSRRFHVLLALAALALLWIACQAAPPDEARLVQAAVDYSYPSIYLDLAALRQDYPGFAPRVRRWSDNVLFLVGEGLYAVQMPEEEVIVRRDGKVVTTRRCGSVEADCARVAPRFPVMGVVGTVQLGDPDYAVARHLQVRWQGTPGEVRIVGHCFWAWKASSEPLVLTITEPGHNSMDLDGVDGRVLVAVQLSKQGSYFASTRLSKAAFEQARDCTPAVRESWPNIGGAAWKR